MARRTLPRRRQPAPDLHGIAFVLIEAMASYRLMRQTFGRTAGDIDDERFIAGWTEITLGVAARYGLE